MSYARYQRRGAAALLLLILMVPLLGLLAFSVDYGFLLYIKTELQRTADQAAIEAVMDLQPDSYGNQDLDKVRATVKTMVELNLGDGFRVENSDIEIGRFNPSTICENIQLLNTGTFDTVRVTVRRDGISNASVSLFFSRIIGHDTSGVVAASTAILQRARFLGPGAKVFPFAIEQISWNKLAQGQTATIYGDGSIEDEFGRKIPGNWGTVDIGPASNSTTSLSDQIRNGLTQADLDSLKEQNAITSSDYIDASITIDLNGDTGLSAGLKHAVQYVEGEVRVAPIYRHTTGGGGTLFYEIVGWVTVEVVGSSWNGSIKSSIEVRKSFTYDANLLPSVDLTDTTNTIEGAYTSPVLIQ